MNIKYLYRVFRPIYAPIIKLFVQIKRKRCLKSWKKNIDKYDDDLSVDLLKAREEFLIDKDSAKFESRVISLMGEQVRLAYDDEIKGTMLLNKDSKRYEYSIGLFRKVLANNIISVNRDELCKYIKKEDILPVALDEEDFYVMQEEGFSKICRSKFGPWIGIIGNQYFDVFEPLHEEIIVDAGAFDGRTELDFLKWGGGEYKKNICF